MTLSRKLKYHQLHEMFTINVTTLNLLTELPTELAYTQQVNEKRTHSDEVLY